MRVAQGRDGRQGNKPKTEKCKRPRKKHSLEIRGNQATYAIEILVFCLAHLFQEQLSKY